MSQKERERASFGDKKDVWGREYASTSEQKSGKNLLCVKLHCVVIRELHKVFF